MAGERIYAARHFKHPTSAVAGVTHARITVTTESKQDQGDAASAGRAGTLRTFNRIRLELFGTNYAALLALIGAASANGVLGTYGAAGDPEKITVKSVFFLEPIAQVEIPEKDSGGKLAPFGVRAMACWGQSDTLATMIVAASDAA